MMSMNLYSRVPTNTQASSTQQQQGGSSSRSVTSRRLVLLMLFGTLLLAAAAIVAMPLWESLKGLSDKKKQMIEMPLEATSHLNSLGFRMLRSLDTEDALISPMSIASAMSMVALGATPASPTQAQLQAVLPAQVPTPIAKDESVTLEVANAAWLTSLVRPSYKSAVMSLGASVHPAPSSVDEVNEWVSDVTKGHITKLMDTVPQPLVALLINAVFFKAKWTTTFDKADTLDRPFHNGDKVPMMHLRRETFPYADISIPNLDNTGKVVELPYGQDGTEFSAVALLPPQDVNLNQVITALSEGGHQLWRSWMDTMTPTKLDVVAMPRFQLSYGVQSLKSSLQSLGIANAFVSNESNPPLQAMTEDTLAYLDDVLHMATVECTEEGTVASAATAAVIMTRSMPPPMPSVVLDRPFLFAIRSRVSGALLFLGRVDHPISPSA